MRITPTLLLSLTLTLATGLLMTSCSDSSSPSGTSKAGTTAATLALNWYPEPEFGGFYAALEEGDYKKHNLDITIRPGGAGAPVIQMIAAGQVPFGIVSADEVIIARSRGAKVVAVFATYQTCPQGIMTHADRNISSLEQLFTTPGTIAMEPGLAYVKYLQKKYTPASDVSIVPYQSGVAQFLNNKSYSQQCFIFSEPLAARRLGADPKVFLVADSGYNPYTAVVATSEEYLKANPQVVKDFVQATRAGWERYLADPAKANKSMAELNPTMDAQTFADAALAQYDLVQDEATVQEGLGTMNRDRWHLLGTQLVELGIIDTAPNAEDCFKLFTDGPDDES